MSSFLNSVTTMAEFKGRDSPLLSSPPSCLHRGPAPSKCAPKWASSSNSRQAKVCTPSNLFFVNCTCILCRMGLSGCAEKLKNPTGRSPGRHLPCVLRFSFCKISTISILDTESSAQNICLLWYNMSIVLSNSRL